MNSRNKILWLIPMLLLTGLLSAQQGSIALLEYIDGDPNEVVITLPSGEEELGYIGMEVELESTIQTGNATVELRLDPNGTIFNLGQDTLFVLNSIQGRRGSDETALTLLQGKLRTVAARTGLGENKYTVRTPTAVCGIRGTEIFNIITADDNSILCKTGLVEVISTANPANRSEISAGQRINTRAVQFTPLPVSPAELSQVFNSLPFQKLTPGNVPGQVQDLAVAEEETEEPQAEEEAAEEETPSEEPAAEEEPEKSPKTEAAAAPVTEEKPVEKEEKEPSKLEEWFRNYMGFEIGAITIDGTTWSKAIAQPVIKTENLSLGLYLPIIYQENLLDPTDWYEPEGNSEWTFGSDQSGWQNIVKDFSSDLFLKVRYLEYGNADWDSFYLKLGNLETMQLGHGSLVYNYNNNTDFPSKRLLGVNAGVTLKNTKLEGLVDHAPEPSLAGGRIQFRSGKPMAIGIASVVDLFPTKEYVDPGLGNLGDPLLIGGSLDLELIKIDKDKLKLLTYADTSAVIPLFRSTPDIALFDASDPLLLIWDGDTLRNFGAKAGVIGKAGLLDFTVDLRYENGIYRHNLFDNLYQHNRVPTILDYIGYLNDPSVVDSSTIGIFGGAGFNLLQEKIRVSSAYLWPWEIDGNKITITDEDYFRLGLEVRKGLIPVYDISGGVYYEKKEFAPSIARGEFSWFDETTQLSGEVVMPLAPTLDLALVVSSSTIYNDQGDLVTESDGFTPKIVPVFNIETRIHF